MKHSKQRIIALLCMAALLLAGCGREVEPGAMGSEVWEQWPTLTYGTMETEKLAVLPWNSGRCEASAKYKMAETENGYYFSYNSYMYYADKTNSDNWVLVCNQPDCEHWDLTAGCNAWFSSGSFIIRNNRIYYTENSFIYPHLYSGKGQGMVLLSMSGAGIDKQLVYVIEDAMLTGLGNTSDLLTAEHWLYLSSSLDNEGNTVTRVFRVTDKGLQAIPINTMGDSQYMPFLMRAEIYGLNGEELFFCNVLDDVDGGYYRFVGEEPTKVDLFDLDLTGAYLSGNTLRSFRTNDGYYDIDLSTQEEIFLAPARQENSFASIVLPNAIIESTLLWNKSCEGRTEEMTHEMDLFDGERWRSVKLPDELVNAKRSVFLTIPSVTSDTIFFIFWDTTDTDYSTPIYRIPLNSEELVIEYCGEILVPHEPEEEE